MFKLIKAELKKIFRKKSFLIVTLIFIAFCVLTNVIYKNMDDIVYIDYDYNIEELKEINKELNLNNAEDLSEYVSNLSIIEKEEIKNSFDDNTSKYLAENLSDLIYERNEAKYIDQDIELTNTLTSEIDTKLTKIKNNDWEYFTKDKINKYKSYLAEATDNVTKERCKEIIKLEEYRLNNNVAYDNDNYLFVAIETIETDLTEYYNLQNKEKLTKMESERLDDLKEEMLINNYILENKEDLNNSSTLRAVLESFASEFSIFILIYVIMISGSIVSEEYSKGTIKYLLTKPYKRSTILTSKLLTVLLLIPAVIIFMVLVELIIGGIIFGFSSLSVPIVLYNASTSALVSYNVFKYTFLHLLSILPVFIVLGIVCFALSTITTSTSAATTITFLFYLLGNVIVTLASTYNIKILKYFVSIHWDFSYLVNLTKHPFGFSTISSILIVIAYLAAILCLTYVYFAKKDVKNI